MDKKVLLMILDGRYFDYETYLYLGYDREVSSRSVAY